jgi:hypothetical protein
MRRTLIAAALAAGLAAPPAASASTYTATLAYPGAPEGWSGQLSPGFVGCAGALATWCPAAGALHAHAAAHAPIAAWSAANLVLAAPPATTIAAADLTLRYRTRDAAVHARVETSTATAGSAYAVTLLADAPAGTTRTVHLAGSGLRRVAAALATDAAVPAGRIASAADDALDVTAARVTLVDGAPPLVALAPPRAGGWYRGRVCLSASATDAGLGVYGVHLDVGGRTVDMLAPASGRRLVPRPVAFSTSLCFDTVPFGDGALTGVATASDGAAAGGNRSAPATFGLRVDNHAPDVSVAAPSATESRSPLIDVGAGDGASGVASVAATVDGAPLALAGAGAGTWRAVPGPLAYGRHVVRVTVADAAGNVADAERVVDVLDATPPRIAGLLPGRGASAPASAVIGFVVRDAGSGVRADSVRVSLDGEDVDASGTLAADGTFRLRPRAPLVPGAHVVHVALADAAGNPATATWGFTVAAPVALRFQRARIAIPAGARTVVELLVRRGVAPVAGARIRFSWAGGLAAGSAVSDAAGRARIVLGGRRGGILVATSGTAVARLRVTLRSVLTLRATPRAGAVVAIAGRLLPAAARGVVIEAYANGRWVGVRALRMTASGRFAARLRLRHGRLYILRASTGTLRSRAVQVWVR